MIENTSFSLAAESHAGHRNVYLPRNVGIALAVICFITFVVGTIGNATVLALFIKYKSLRTSANRFVINLAIPDLMLCIVSLPMLIHYHIREEVVSDVQIWFCRINNFFAALTGFLSIWSLACLAFDRFIVIRRSLPIRYSSDKVVANYVIATIWTCSLIFAAFPLCGYGRLSIEGLTNSCDASDNFRTSLENMLYNISIQVLFFVIPVVCIASCYYAIYTKVKHHEKIYFSVRRSGQHNEASFRRMRKSRKLERSELKTAKVGLILIACFCLSWTPYSIISWIGLIGNRESLTPLMVAIPAIFAKVFTVLNPVLYALSLQSFKTKLKLFWVQYFKSESSQSGSVDRSFPLPENTTNLQNFYNVPRPCRMPDTSNKDRAVSLHDNCVNTCTIPNTCSLPNIQDSVCVVKVTSNNRITTTVNTVV